MPTKLVTPNELLERFENGDAMCVLFYYEGIEPTLENVELADTRFIGGYDSPGEWLQEWSEDTPHDMMTDWEAAAEELEAQGLFVYYDYFGSVFVFRSARNLRGDINMDARFPICPRCNGYIPSNENPGAHIGAVSRLDNKTEVCSQCGTEESVQQFRNGFVTDWRLRPEDDLGDVDAITQANREAGVCLDCARDVAQGSEYCDDEACQEALDRHADWDYDSIIAILLSDRD